ncbi:MAG: hypothetical protein RIA72_00095 [Sphingopyxis sp.]|jgi:hypothetical protein|uniref:DUF7662 domain-containing protein n=1 Tax=Sphingopyxis sp. TaxID=1908224 RepID=UPI0032EB00F5
MGKYEPLGDHLRALSEDRWNASFEEIEHILGFRLPNSARDHRAWWSNHSGGNHSQAAVWVEAGWETRDVDQARERIRFERVRKVRSGEPRSGSRTEPVQELWAEAARLTGIENRAELERAAVTALIQREAARALALMGGTDPDAAPPPRGRPFG